MNRDRIKTRITEIAASPKNVRFEDLENLLDNHIKHLFPNYNHHGNPHHAFTVGDETFNIAKPHQGFVKAKYIEYFLKAMQVLDLYEPEPDR